MAEPIDYETRKRKSAELARFVQGQSKGSAAAHERIGAAIAVLGGIVAAIGFHYFDADGQTVGTSPAWSIPAMSIGLICFCIGAIWFAFGRMKR